VIDLAEARAIKAAVIQSFAGDLDVRPDRGPAIWADDVDVPPRPRLAVGIAGNPITGYRLQARPQDRSGHTVAALRELRDRTLGEVDVIEIGPVKALASAEQSRVRPLERGISIGPEESETGTLGAFVREVSGQRRLLILSNNHVLAETDRRPVGAAIVQPGHDDGGSSSDIVARLLRAIPLDRRRPNRVDAAVAIVASAVAIDARRPTGLRGTVERTSDPVEKRGRTTGSTTGTITAFELDNVVVTYPDSREYRFDGQLEITGTGGAFSTSGDSGSLVIAGDRAIGLLFAGYDSGGPGGHGQSYANPIGAVLSALNVALEL
jgi:hypothetical protein